MEISLTELQASVCAAAVQMLGQAIVIDVRCLDHRTCVLELADSDGRLVALRLTIGLNGSSWQVRRVAIEQAPERSVAYVSDAISGLHGTVGTTGDRQDHHARTGDADGRAQTRPEAADAPDRAALVATLESLVAERDATLRDVMLFPESRDDLEPFIETLGYEIADLERTIRETS